MRILIIIVAIGLVIGGIVYFVKSPNGEPVIPAGGALDELIQVTSPKPNALVASPMTITGKARGYWYFEASFPVQLLDANGAILYEGPIQADGEWMTEEFVPFSQEISFAAPMTKTGTLVLKKDNPSGLPENDNELRIPVRFDAAQPVGQKADFNTPISLGIGDQVTIGNELVVTLKEINDSRCKPDVQCVWAGELSALFIVGELAGEIRLGTVNNKTKAYAGYTLVLDSATETKATIVVTKTAQTGGNGSLNGYVHIGPTCPVVRAGEEDECADRPYATSIEIHYPDERLHSIVSSGADGRFLVTLPVGQYILRPQAANVMPSCSEERIAVVAGATVNVDISCDSGIR